jgi:predicted DNA-binding transcriptional regulator YafY
MHDDEISRLSRLTAILTLLQTKRTITAAHISEKYGVSVRTVYRDIRSLEASGVPIVSEAGSGYSLMEGYRLPPIMFTKDEATAFLTAEKLVEKLTDSATYETYQNALLKIKAVLKTDEKDHLENMHQYIEVVENPYLPKKEKTSNHIPVILKSISLKNSITINYLTNYTNQKTIRDVEPLGIFLMTGQWYLIAFCTLRNDYRNFRVDRIAKINLTNQPYRKKHPPLKTYLSQIKKEKKELYEVIMQIEKSTLKYIGEQKFYNGFISEKEIGDKIEMTFLTTSLEGFARWYMMFGDYAEIIKPQRLKTQIKEISSQILKRVK